MLPRAATEVKVEWKCVLWGGIPARRSAAAPPRLVAIPGPHYRLRERRSRLVRHVVCHRPSCTASGAGVPWFRSWFLQPLLAAGLPIRLGVVFGPVPPACCRPPGYPQGCPPAWLCSRASFYPLSCRLALPGGQACLPGPSVHRRCVQACRAGGCPRAHHHANRQRRNPAWPVCPGFGLLSAAGCRPPGPSRPAAKQASLPLVPPPWPRSLQTGARKTAPSGHEPVLPVWPAAVRVAARDVTG